MRRIVLQRVLETISRYNMLAPGDRVVVAVSGGADSVCLLHVLSDAGISVAGVAHFNHKLRGEESEEDERFVATIAARMALPFFARRRNSVWSKATWNRRLGGLGGTFSYL